MDTRIHSVPNDTECMQEVFARVHVDAPDCIVSIMIAKSHKTNKKVELEDTERIKLMVQPDVLKTHHISAPVLVS